MGRLWHKVHQNPDGTHESGIQKEFYSFFFNTGENYKLTETHMFQKYDDTYVLAKDVEIGYTAADKNGKEIMVEDIKIELGLHIYLHVYTPHILVNGVCASTFTDKDFYWRPVLDAI